MRDWVAPPTPEGRVTPPDLYGWSGEVEPERCSWCRRPLGDSVGDECLACAESSSCPACDTLADCDPCGRRVRASELRDLVVCGIEASACMECRGVAPEDRVCDDCGREIPEVRP